MWNTNSLWLEVAVISMVFAVGNIMFGHFEEQTPKYRRVGKYFLILSITIILSMSVGRVIAFSIIGAFIVPILYVHGYYLPRKKGINGWTGEPKAKYYEFRGWDKNIFKLSATDKPPL